MRFEQVCRQFAKQLREIELIKAFKIYIGFLVKFCSKGDKPLGQFTTWQLEDMFMSLQNDKIDTSKEILETFWLYTRRGGKTKNLTIIAVFLSLMGYLVMWRASFSDQLNMAKFWFLKNPFVEKVVMQSQDNQVRVIDSNPINFDVLSEGKTQSRGVDVVMLDEECLIPIDSKKYDIYEKLRPALADSSFKHFIHGTTAEKNTVAEMNYNFLIDKQERMNTTFISEHDADDCEWITDEFIASERMLHSDDPYYVDMQYYNKWTVAGGMVFNSDKIYIVDTEKYNKTFSKEYWSSLITTNAGVDFNGDINKHYLVEVSITGNIVNVIRETPFTELSFLLDYSTSHPKVSLELEDGLYNTQFTEQTKRMGLRCIYNMNWSGATKSDKKMVRVQELRNKTIIIDKKECSLTYKNLNTCAWNRKVGKTEILKTSDQHGLDALLHAMHESGGEVKIFGHVKRDLFGEVMRQKLPSL